MDATEAAYINAYRNVIIAVSNVTKYVTPALRQQIDALERKIGNDAHIEELREIARERL